MNLMKQISSIYSTVTPAIDVDLVTGDCYEVRISAVKMHRFFHDKALVLVHVMFSRTPTTISKYFVEETGSISTSCGHKGLKRRDFQQLIALKHSSGGGCLTFRDSVPFI